MEDIVRFFEGRNFGGSKRRQHSADAMEIGWNYRSFSWKRHLQSSERQNRIRDHKKGVYEAVVLVKKYRDKKNFLQEVGVNVLL